MGWELAVFPQPETQQQREQPVREHSSLDPHTPEGRTGRDYNPKTDRPDQSVYERGATGKTSPASVVQVHLDLVQSSD